MYIYCVIFVILIILLSVIDIYSYNTFKILKSFKQFYYKEEMLLHYEFEELMGCLNIEPLFNCMRKDKEI